MLLKLAFCSSVNNIPVSEYILLYNVVSGDFSSSGCPKNKFLNFSFFISSLFLETFSLFNFISSLNLFTLSLYSFTYSPIGCQRIFDLSIIGFKFSSINYPFSFLATFTLPSASFCNILST